MKGSQPTVFTNTFAKNEMAGADDGLSRIWQIKFNGHPLGNLAFIGENGQNTRLRDIYCLTSQL